MLTKGPVAILLPWVIFAAYLLLLGYSYRAFTAPAKVFLPAFLIASLWYLLALERGGPAFGDLVFSENIARFLGAIEEGKDPQMEKAAEILGKL